MYRYTIYPDASNRQSWSLPIPREMPPRRKEERKPRDGYVWVRDVGKLGTPLPHPAIPGGAAGMNPASTPVYRSCHPCRGS